MSRFIRKPAERSQPITQTYDSATGAYAPVKTTSAATKTTTGGLTKFKVVNPSWSTQMNGGYKCDWIVPEGTNWASFEMWGGGGGGSTALSGGYTDSGGKPGGAGAFACKVMRVTPGEKYTICAGGTSCCMDMSTSSCTGSTGFPSFVTKNGSLVLCAGGGLMGISMTSAMTCYISYNHCDGCQSTFDCTKSYGQCGQAGWWFSNVYCSSDAFQVIPSAPRTGSQRIGTGGCNGNNCADWVMGGCATFPGGGGATGQSCCGFGQYGASGLVIVTYGG